MIEKGRMVNGGREGEKGGREGGGGGEDGGGRKGKEEVSRGR